MNVSIGKGPDFVLMRGREILCYRFQIVIQFPNQRIETRILSNRSLAMVCKELKSTYMIATGVKSDRDIKICYSGRQITFEAEASNIEASIKLMSPLEISSYQYKSIIQDSLVLLNITNS